MRGRGQSGRGREQTVGLVCCCVLPCLGFQRPDDYGLIPGDSFLVKEILPSFRLTEVISPLQTTRVKERIATLRKQAKSHAVKNHHTDVFMKKKLQHMFAARSFAELLCVSGSPLEH